jgi:GT2 family glycosyltransferase
LDVIIISYNTQDITSSCITSVLESYQEAGIIVVDNNSNDGTQENIKKSFPQITLIENKENFGYAKAVNIGMKYSSAEIAVISNSDVTFNAKSLQTLENTLFENENIAVCAPQQVYPDGTWQYSFGDLPGIFLGFKELFFITTLERYLAKKKWENGTLKSFYPGYLDGAVLAVKRKVFEQISGFDEDYFFYTEEADFCKRIKDTGHEILFEPKAEVIHLRGGSSGHFNIDSKKAEMFISSKILYCKKHLSKFETMFYVFLEKLGNFVKYIVWSIVSIFGISNAKNKSKWFKEILKAWNKLA